MAELRYVDWDGLVYYDGKIKSYIADKLEECMKFMGERDTIENLPDPSYNTLNTVYKITSPFEVSLSNGDFAENARGKSFSANTVVCVTDFEGIYLYSILFEPASSTGTTNVDLSNYYTRAEVDDLLPTKVSDLDNDSGYLTSIPDGYATEEYVQSAIESIDTPEINTDDYYTKEEVNNLIPATVSELTNDAGYITEQDISDKSDIGHTHSLSEITDYQEPDLSGYALKSELPTVPTKTSELTNDSNFATTEEVEEVRASIPNIGGLATQDSVDSLSDIVDELSTNKADKASLDSKLDVETYNVDKGAFLTEDSLAGYAKTTEIENTYATQTFVQQKIAEAELSGSEVDLSAFYTKDETYNRDEIDAKIPDVSNFITSIPEEYVTDSELANKGYLTEHQSLAEYAKKTDIPDVSKFITEIPEEYVTDTELLQKGYLTEHQDISGKADVLHTHTMSEITDYVAPDLTPYALKAELPTKVSAFENDLGYLTQHQSLDDYAKKSDIPTVDNFITMSDVEEKGYLTSVPAEYITESELEDMGYITDISGKADVEHTHSYNDLDDKPEIPSTEGLATEQYVDDAITTMTEALSTKANDILFNEDMRVTTPYGTFENDESVMGLSIRELFIKLLGLELHQEPSDPDTPKPSEEVIAEIIETSTPMHQVNENGEVVEVPYAYTQMNETTAAEAPTTDCFYQITDAEGAIVESGYQHLSEENDSMYYVVALPIGMDFNSNVTVQFWDSGNEKWVDTKLNMSCDPNLINEAFSDADIPVPTIDTTKYTLWIDASLDTCAGTDYRFIINE